MDFLEKIIKCSDEEVDSIIEIELQKLEEKAEKKDYLGIVSRKPTKPFKGFIPSSTRINITNDSFTAKYSMKTRDFFYEYVKGIRKSGINSKYGIVTSIAYFLNCYFGKISGKDLREDYLENIVSSESNPDSPDYNNQYLESIDRLEIGVMKGQNIAMCTERGAVAQNLLSLFGIESYYCVGSVSYDDKLDSHCFNVIKGIDCFLLADYSITVPSYNKYGKIIEQPFIGIIQTDEIEDFLVKGKEKTFDKYEYVYDKTTKNNIRKPIEGTVTYCSGNFSLINKKRNNINF